MTPADVPKFTTPTKQRKTLAVDLDGVILHAVKPKAALMVNLAQLTEGTDAEQASIVNQFIDIVFDGDAAEHIHNRLEDPDDDLDIDDLGPLVEWLSGEFAARPTGSPPASTARRRAISKRSTGGVASTG